jgi:hypothetical protein
VSRRGATKPPDARFKGVVLFCWRICAPVLLIISRHAMGY